MQLFLLYSLSGLSLYIRSLHGKLIIADYNPCRPENFRYWWNANKIKRRCAQHCGTTLFIASRSLSFPYIGSLIHYWPFTSSANLNRLRSLGVIIQSPPHIGVAVARRGPNALLEDMSFRRDTWCTVQHGATTEEAAGRRGEEGARE